MLLVCVSVSQFHFIFFTMLDSLLFALFYWARYSILEKYHMNNKVGGDGRNLPATYEKAQKGTKRTTISHWFLSTDSVQRCRLFPNCWCSFRTVLGRPWGYDRSLSVHEPIVCLVDRTTCRAAIATASSNARCGS